MTRVFRISLCGAAVSVLMAASAPPFPISAHARAEVFATCAGRLAALATNQASLGNPDHERTSQARDLFDIMLEATIPAALDDGVPDNVPGLWRSAGWAEIASLLNDMHYSLDNGRSNRAKTAIEARITDCERLVL